MFKRFIAKFEHKNPRRSITTGQMTEDQRRSTLRRITGDHTLEDDNVLLFFPPDWIHPTNLPSARIFTISDWELIVPGMDDYPEARCFALGLNVDDANNFIAVRKQFEYAYSRSQFRNCDRLDFPKAWNAMQIVVETLAENLVLLPTLKYLPLAWRQAWIRRMMLYLWGEEVGGFGISARIEESERQASSYIQQGLHIYRNSEPPKGGGGGFGGNWITAASNPHIDAQFRDAFEEAERLYYARETVSENVPQDHTFLFSRTSLYSASIAIPREKKAIELKFFLKGVSTADKELFPIEELPASTCLAPGGDARIISSYKLDLFAQEFEKAINLKRSEHPVNIRWGGRLYFMDSEDRLRRIDDQGSFEIALKYLQARHKDGCFPFEFQEAEDKKIRMDGLSDQKIEAYWGGPTEIRQVPDVAKEDNRPQSALTKNPRLTKPRRTQDTSSTASRIPQRQMPKVETPVAAPRASPTPDMIQRSSSGAISMNSSSRGNRRSLSAALGEILRSRPSTSTLGDNRSLHQSNTNEPLVKTPSSRFTKIRQSITGKKPAPTTTAVPEQKKWQYKVVKIDRYKRGYDEDELGVTATTQRDNTGESDDAVADELEEEEEELEDESNTEELMVMKLQKLLNGYDMGQLAPQDPTRPSDGWMKCCAMFNITPATLKRHQRIAVYGLRTELYQYQAFAVYWQMVKSREIGGGFIGDDPGLGKTLTYLAYLVCERQLTILEEAVTKARKERNFKQHRSADHPDDGQGCPSYPNGPKPGWITCPCYKASPTYGMGVKPGVRLAVVPDHLVRDWFRSFVTHVDVGADNMLNMRVVVADPTMFPTGRPGADPRDSRNSATHNLVQADRKPFGKTGRFADDEPHAAQDRILVITTSKQFPAWVKKFEYPAIIESKGVWSKGKNPGIVFGIAMVDEFHDEPLKNKGRCGVLCSLPTGNWNVPFIWGYSGTPFSDSPRTLEGVLWAIESHYPVTSYTDKRSGWAQKDEFRHLSNPVFDQLCKDFQQLVKNKSRDERATEDIIIRFKHFLDRFMLRRTTETKWQGGSMIKLNPSTHCNIALEHNAAFDEAIKVLTQNVEKSLPSKLKEFQAKWDRADADYQQRYKRPTKLTARTELMLKWRLRVVATLPYLAKLATLPEGHTDRLDLGIKEFLTFKNPHSQAMSPYLRYLSDIVQSSPKLAWLRRFIIDLKQTTDVDKQEQKLVIITNFNPVALIIKLFIEKFVKDSKDRVGGVYAGMTPKARADAIESFTDAKDEKGNRKQKHDYQFLVGTTKFLNTGLQLTRACNVVLMEPDFIFANEIQSYARVYRIGQKNPESRSYRLIDNGSAIEKAIIERQVNRQEYVGRLDNSDTEGQFVKDGGSADVTKALKTHEELINQTFQDEQSLREAQQKLEAGNWPLRQDSLSSPFTPPRTGHDPEPMDPGRLRPSLTRGQGSVFTPAKTPNPNPSFSPIPETPTPAFDTFSNDDIYGTSPPRKTRTTTSAPMFEHAGRGLAITWEEDQNRDIPRPLFSGPSDQRQGHQSSGSDPFSRAETSLSGSSRPAVGTTVAVGSPIQLPVPGSGSPAITHGSAPRRSVADSTTTRLATQTSDTAIRELILPTLVAQGSRVSETSGTIEQNPPVSSSDTLPPPPPGSKFSDRPKIKEVGERRSNTGSVSAPTRSATAIATATPARSISPTQERQATFITPDPNAGNVSGFSSAFSLNSSSRRSSRIDKPGQSPRQPTFISPVPNTGVTSTASQNSSVQRSSRIDRDGQSPRQPTFISPDPDAGITSRASGNSSVRRSSRIDEDGREARQPTFIAPGSYATVERPVRGDPSPPRSAKFDPDAEEKRQPSFLG